MGNKSQTTVEYLANYSDASLNHSRGAGSEKKSYTSVASSKILHGRPTRRQGSEKQSVLRQPQKRELKPRQGDTRPSPVSVRNYSRQSSSTISQPITFRQKAGINVLRGSMEHPQDAKNKKKPSVPTQIKAEALWCDGLLQVTLMAEPSE